MLEAAVSGDLQSVAQVAAAHSRGIVAIVVPGSGTTVAPAGVPSPAALDALRRLAAERVRGRPAPLPFDLLGEAPIVRAGECAGIVALLDAGEPTHEKAGELIEHAATASMVALAFDDVHQQAELGLKGRLIEALLAGEELEPGELVRRGARLGCNLTAGAAVLALEPIAGAPRWTIASVIADAHPGALVEELAVDERGTPRIYALLPSPAPEPAAANRLLSRLRRHGVAALSSAYADPAQLACAVREAELSLAVVLDRGPLGEDRLAGGTYRLLLRLMASQPDGVDAFYRSSLAPLVRHDEIYHTHLVATLDAYLKSNCNLQQTSRAMFAHRHTVAHRLERIHELTGLDPTDYDDREHLGLALKVRRLARPPSGRVAPSGE